MRHFGRFLLPLLLGAVFTRADAGATPSYQEVFPNGYPRAISADARYVLVDGPTIVDRATGGIRSIPEGYTPVHLTADGTAILRKGPLLDLHRAPLDGPITPLFSLETSALNVVGASRDGSVVILSGIAPDPVRGVSFLWSAPTGLVPLALADPNVSVNANGISVDGSVVGGTLQVPQAFSALGRYTLDGGWEPVAFGAIGLALSSDGTTIVGASSNDQGDFAAIRWRAATGLEPLGALAGSSESFAYGISGDGNVVVGSHGDGQFPNERAFVWDEESGMRDVQALLEGAGIDLEGVVLWRGVFVSEDGRTIVGVGRPAGDIASRFVWAAVIPEPGTHLLLGAGLLGLAAVPRYRAA